MHDKVMKKNLKLQPFTVIVFVKIALLRYMYIEINIRACSKLLMNTLQTIYLSSAATATLHLHHLLLKASTGYRLHHLASLVKLLEELVYLRNACT